MSHSVVLHAKYVFTKKITCAILFFIALLTSLKVWWSPYFQKLIELNSF